MEIDYNIFSKIIINICRKDTSSSPDAWISKNPLFGHCAVVSLLAQDIWGGEILRASLSNTYFANLRSHYWNLLENGLEIDFTKEQFTDNYPGNLPSEISSREHILSYPPTFQRYELLKTRFRESLSKSASEN